MLKLMLTGEAGAEATNTVTDVVTKLTEASADHPVVSWIVFGAICVASGFALYKLVIKPFLKKSNRN